MIFSVNNFLFAAKKLAIDLLQSCGKTVDYGPDAGAANVVKLCGNFLIAVKLMTM